MISDQNFPHNFRLTVTVERTCGDISPISRRGSTTNSMPGRKNFSDGWAAVDEAAGDYRVGVASYSKVTSNWNSGKSDCRTLSEKGVVGEVPFPKNTAPPFFFSRLAPLAPQAPGDGEGVRIP